MEGGAFVVSRTLAASVDLVADYDFPPDLVQLQRDFLAANQQWADAAKGDDREAITAAYLEAQRLAMALHRHPWLVERGRHNDARMALRKRAGG